MFGVAGNATPTPIVEVLRLTSKCPPICLVDAAIHLQQASRVCTGVLKVLVPDRKVFMRWESVELTGQRRAVRHFAHVADVKVEASCGARPWHGPRVRCSWL